MPYIDQQFRPLIDPYVTELMAGVDTPGKLNYAITKMILRYMHKKAAEPNYDLYAMMVGTLESVKLELYRRSVAPYEDRKRDFNGDVF